MSTKNKSSSWIEDFILLAFFFVTVYALTYTVLRLSDIFQQEKIISFLRSPSALVIYFALGVMTGILGVKEIYLGVYRKGRISIGFSLIFISAMFFITFFILSINMLLESLNKLLFFLGI